MPFINNDIRLLYASFALSVQNTISGYDSLNSLSRVIEALAASNSKRRNVWNQSGNASDEDLTFSEKSLIA